MGNSTSKTIIKKENDVLVQTFLKNDNIYRQEKYPIIENNYIFYTENQWAEIKKKGYKDVDYCLLDNNSNGIMECAGLFSFDKNKLNQFSVTKGDTPCKSFFYRPGLIFTNDPNNTEERLNDLGSVENGKLCRLVYRDEINTDYDTYSCCIKSKKNDCNVKFSDDYKTSHCNEQMKRFCSLYPEHENCMLWLENNIERRENQALEFYSDYCSKNHKSKACDYFCKVSRENSDYRSSYCDVALTKFCKNNSDPLCGCVNDFSATIPATEEYLGPKECWFSPCSSQTDSKWLLTDQIQTRKNCLLTSCVITIDDLILNGNSKAELINNCVTGTSVNSSYEIKKEFEENNFRMEIEKVPGIFLFFPMLLFSGMLLLLLKIK